MPKRYVTDSGLATWLMGVDREGLKKDAGARGRIIDNFVAAQLRTEVFFHTGPHRYWLDEGIEAVPICGLWG